MSELDSDRCVFVIKLLARLDIHITLSSVVSFIMTVSGSSVEPSSRSPQLDGCLNEDLPLEDRQELILQGLMKAD